MWQVYTYEKWEWTALHEALHIRVTHVKYM